MNQTIPTVLKTVFFAQMPQTCHQAALLEDDALETAMYALCSKVSITLQAMPGGLAFMFLSVPLHADWHNPCTSKGIDQ